MDEAEKARWLVAPFVSRAARELARERGIQPEQLSEATMYTLQDLALLAYGEGVLNRQVPSGVFQAPPMADPDPWGEGTPTQPQRPSRRPTRRVPR